MGKSGSGNVSLAERKRQLQQALNTGSLVLHDRHKGYETVPTEDGFLDTKPVIEQYPDFTQQVNKGAKLLDEAQPYWYMHIDTSVLDLDNENMCVLGQSWNHYKVGDDVLAELQVSDPYNEKTNFQKFLDVLFKNKNKYDRKMISADYGFAFTTGVYAWLNLEADRRYQNKIGPQGAFTRRNGTIYTGKTAISWRIEAELWEHLTTTWLVLIKARQQQHLDNFIKQLTAAGMTNPPAEEVAKSLVKDGIYDVASAIEKLASNNSKPTPLTFDPSF